MRVVVLAKDVPSVADLAVVGDALEIVPALVAQPARRAHAHTDGGA